jgi:hypothetical protein
VTPATPYEPRGRRLLAHAVALALAATTVTACAEVESAAVEGYEPAHLKEVKGSDFKEVAFTPEGAERTGLETASVRRAGARMVVPYAALIYDPEGKTYVYTSPKRLTFMRAEVKVDAIKGDRALLATGPPAGTQVVTVGTAEVYGAELEIAGGH